MSNPYYMHKTVFSPTDKYTNHRIPGMLVTSKGTLLLYCEARQNSSDWAMMDILLIRSTDNGKTFSNPTALASGNEKYNTVNNPVMMQDKNGRIHFLYLEDYSVNGGRAMRRYSDDDGETWSEPIDVTHFTKPEIRNALAFGPGHGIITYDGTLLVPVWIVLKEFNAPINSHSPSIISTFFSKDNGETWSFGEFLSSTNEIQSPNETVATLTSDKKVYLNVRNQNSYRVKAYSKNGYSDWTDYAPDYNLVDPQCFGSVAFYNDGEHPYTLFFANCDNALSRVNVSVKASVDDGKSYPLSLVLDKDRGGYVEIAVDNNAKLVYVAYEEDWGRNDYLAVFNYDYFISNAVKK